MTDGGDNCSSVVQFQVRISPPKNQQCESTDGKTSVQTVRYIWYFPSYNKVNMT